MRYRGGNPRRNDALFGESIVGHTENICMTVTGLLVECYRSISSFLLLWIRSEHLLRLFCYNNICGEKPRKVNSNMKRIISLILATVMVVLSLALTSCGGVDPAKDLDNILAEGKLVVGMECAYAPYNWSEPNANDYTVKVENGTYADGFDVQIAKLIADALGVELVIRAIEWDGLIPALEAGEIDMIIAGMSPTEERKLSIAFSDTYFDSNLVMVVKADGTYASADNIQDFSGAKITAQLNTFHYTVIDQINGVNKQTALHDFSALIQSLDSGAIDGYVCEKPGAISAVAANDGFTYVEFAEGNGFTCDPAESSISVGVRQESSLLDAINTAIAALSTADKEAMMDAAIERQPDAE